MINMAEEKKLIETEVKSKSYKCPYCSYDFGVIEDPTELNDKLLHIPGVVDTGLFIGMASQAYIGTEDGNVDVL